MEVDSVGIIAILSMSHIPIRIVKTLTSVAKIPRVPVEHQISTLSVVKIPIKFSPCSFRHSNTFAQQRVKLAHYLLLCVAITCKYACHQKRFYALYS